MKRQGIRAIVAGTTRQWFLLIFRGRHLDPQFGHSERGLAYGGMMRVGAQFAGFRRETKIAFHPVCAFVAFTHR